MALYVLNLFPSAGINQPETLNWRGNNIPDPLKTGDIILVNAQFGTYNKNGQPVTPSNYYGLSVGACFEAGVTKMKTKDLLNKGYLGITVNITDKDTPDSNDFFINAVSYTETIDRDDQEIDNITFQWQFEYQPSATLQAIIDKGLPQIYLVADYGDPHEGAIAIKVKK